MTIKNFIRVLGMAAILMLTQEEAVAIANMAYTEANAESEYGCRLVIDCALNRVEDERFPNTVMGVLRQKGQFASGKNAPAEFVKMVFDEAETRTNDQVLWFRTGRYHSWGEPILQEGAHYFSGIKGVQE